MIISKSKLKLNMSLAELQPQPVFLFVLYYTHYLAVLLHTTATILDGSRPSMVFWSLLTKSFETIWTLEFSFMAVLFCTVRFELVGYSTVFPPTILRHMSKVGKHPSKP